MPTLLFVAACGGGGDLSGNTHVISDIPWSVPETASYRILNGDDVVGSGVLRIEDREAGLLLSQDFQATDEQISDDVSVLADPLTLQPQTVSRTIDGPEGKRICDTRYEGSKATVDQRSGNDERKDVLQLPANSFDTWGDLFLWRTLDFRDGFDVTYNGVLTCSLVKPDVISVVLVVKGLETVEVPAGTYRAWRLEIRSGGETTHVWYADDGRRTLVRYDNGQHVFELESVQ